MKFRKEAPGGKDYGDPMHVNAEAILKKKTEAILTARPKEADFVGKPYSRFEIEQDIVRIAQHRSHHKAHETQRSRENKKLADIFEAVVILGISRANWLGEEVSAQNTAYYDDFQNDVDILLEFKKSSKDRYLGLAADVTFSSDIKVLQRKFVTLEEKIRKGTLTEIKYVHPGQDGPLSMVPEVIVGVSASMVRELADLLTKDKMMALEQHPASVLLLLQARAQLDTFKAYALRYDQEEVAEIFSNMSRIIDKLLEQKGDRVAETERDHADDVTHKAIMRIATT